MSQSVSAISVPLTCPPRPRAPGRGVGKQWSCADTARGTRMPRAHARRPFLLRGLLRNLCLRGEPSEGTL
eukprot:8281321-Alexandrium_andersonii.AAC.1